MHLLRECESHSEPLTAPRFGVDADELSSRVDDKSDALSCFEAGPNQARRMRESAFSRSFSGGAPRKFERSVEQNPDIGVELLLRLDDEQLASASRRLPSDPTE